VTLPLFDPPPAPKPTVERIASDSPEAFAYALGFKQGAAGLAKTTSSRYADPRVLRYYEDGYRIGRLFRPLPCMAGVDRHRRR
jgi:hypothetical protein